MQNSGKDLLKPSQEGLGSAPNRKTVTTANSGVEISLQNPLEDYKRLVKHEVMGGIRGIQDNFSRIANVARDVIWRLLFAQQPAKAADKAKAAELLTGYRQDAIYYDPFAYNNWIVLVRDELLKREMHDFWREQIVAHELGLCWARDCNFFDDAEDKQPAEFYNYAGCVAPFPFARKELSEVIANEPSTPVVPSNTSLATEPFEANISMVTPLEDYKKLLDERVLVDEYVNEQLLQENFVKIAAAMQDVIWQMLFSANTSESTAAQLLKSYKIDARFHSPWDYNTWIVKVRDELLKRKMLDFWRDVVVKFELGPCWARDSDYFDEMDDPAPAEFYKRAGCEPPFETPSS